MVSIVKTYTIVNENDKKIITGELRGKSTDTKLAKIPTLSNYQAFIDAGWTIN